MSLTKALIFVSTIVAFVFSSQTTFACSCMYAGKFIEYTSNGGIVRANVKELGSKLSHGDTLYESMTVEVSEVIKGQYNKKEITFLGDPGHLCRAYVDSERFKIGSEHLISISNNDPIQPLGGCGESAVVIKDGKVQGVEIIDKRYESYSIDLKDYLKMLKAK